MSDMHCTLARQMAQTLQKQGALLARGPRAMALELGDLDLSLPAIGNGVGVGARLSPEALRAYAALYYFATAEQTGMMSLAELLAEEVFSLGINDRDLFQALSDLGDAVRGQWYDADRRALIFQSMVPLDGQAGLNAYLAPLAQAIGQFESMMRFSGRMSYRESAAVEMAGTALLRMISSKAAMGLERAAQILHAQYTRVIPIMGMQALHRRYSATNTEALLTKLVVPVDGVALIPLSTAERRGRAGTALIAWLAGAPDMRVLLENLPGQRDVFAAAAEWQMSFGRDPQAGRSVSRGGWA